METLTISQIEQELKHQDSPMVLASYLTILAAYTSQYTESLRVYTCDSCIFQIAQSDLPQKTIDKLNSPLQL